MSLSVDGEAKKNDFGLPGTSPDHSGEGLQATASAWNWMILPVNSASHNSVYFMRCYLSRTYAPGSMQPAQRLPNTPPSQEDTHRNRKLQYDVVSVLRNAGQRKGYSRWLLKDEEEFTREKASPKGQKLFLLFAFVSPAPKTEPGT